MLRIVGTAARDYHSNMADVDSNTDGSSIESAYAFLRGHTTGDLRFDEHLRSIKYIIAPDGRLAAPVMVAMLQSVDTVLFVPECVENSLEVQVTMEEFDERSRDGAIADRWRIYHGEPQDVRWAWLDIDGARRGRMVYDGDAMMRPNPLAGDEARICRHMNEDHADDLRALCLHFAKVEIESPVMVGIDPLGIDVRGMFDVFRVEATEPMNNTEDARRVLTQMTKQAV